MISECQLHFARVLVEVVALASLLAFVRARVVAVAVAVAVVAQSVCRVRTLLRSVALARFEQMAATGVLIAGPMDLEGAVPEVSFSCLHQVCLLAERSLLLADMMDVTRAEEEVPAVSVSPRPHRPAPSPDQSTRL